MTAKMLADAESADPNKNQKPAAEVTEGCCGRLENRGSKANKSGVLCLLQMLNDGWDANNVTQILGLRAFNSQLLCEQVVGRGLRRMNYTPDPETGSPC